MEDELRVLEDKLDAEDDDELFCVACDKEMRNVKAFAIHRKQKKHLENVEKLREVLLEDDLVQSDELGISEGDPDDHNDYIEPKDPQEQNSDSVAEVAADRLGDTKCPDDAKKSKKPRRNKGNKKNNPNNITKENDTILDKTKTVDLKCAICKVEFPSKNKLFGHLKDTGHATALR